MKNLLLLRFVFVGHGLHPPFYIKAGEVPEVPYFSRNGVKRAKISAAIFVNLSILFSRNAVKRAKKKLPGFQYTKGYPSAQRGSGLDQKSKSLYTACPRHAREAEITLPLIPYHIRLQKLEGNLRKPLALRAFRQIFNPPL
jgi:hypothetical protein